MTDEGDEKNEVKKPPKSEPISNDEIFKTHIEDDGEPDIRIDNSVSQENKENSKSRIRAEPKHKIEDYDMIVGRLKDAASSFKEGFVSIGKKAQEIKDKAGETFTVGAKRDAREIRALGIYADNVIKGYENTMTEINKKDYADQERLLKGYKKLLEEQINLINARIELVKRLKSPDK
jgi:hypothetical protein